MASPYVSAVKTALSRESDRLEIFLVEGRTGRFPNWFWYVKDKSGKIIKRCRVAGVDSYYQAAQEAIDEYNALQSKGIP